MVVVTLTTIPERLNATSDIDRGVKACIRSLCSQDYDEYEVHFNIPYTYKLHGTEYIIPDWLNELCEEFPHLKVFRTEDYGPITKLVPTLDRITDGKTILIVVDDDHVYHHEMVREHVKNQAGHYNYAFGYDGLDAVSPPVFGDVRDHFVTMVHVYVRVQVLQHYKSVSYLRRYFEDDFKSFLGKTNSDDILVSAYMGFKEIKKCVSPYHGDVVNKNEAEWHANINNSFPRLGSVAHDANTGCTDPIHKERFFIPKDLEPYLLI